MVQWMAVRDVGVQGFCGQSGASAGIREGPGLGPDKSGPTAGSDPPTAKVTGQDTPVFRGGWRMACQGAVGQQTAVVGHVVSPDYEAMLGAQKKSRRSRLRGLISDP